MAYTYKTVGTSTAAVLTLLAAGTLLWFQRPPAPVEMPRPQDEAAIMHATLERHYAMLRTNQQFGKTFPNNVSTIISTNVWSNYIGGAWVTDPNRTGTEFAVYSYITNSPAHTDTNTVAWYPNATYQYPNSIRSAIMSRVATEGEIYWVLPTNNYLTTGNNEFYFDECPSNRMDADPDYWTNLVTLPVAHWITSTNYAYTNIVFTNFPPSTNWFWQTNVLHCSTNFTNSASVNTRLGTNSPYTIPAKAMAFERDKNALYWSTNAYNDMARPLALMQWARDERPNLLGPEPDHEVYDASVSTWGIAEIKMWGRPWSPTRIYTTTCYISENRSSGSEVPWNGKGVESTPRQAFDWGIERNRVWPQTDAWAVRRRFFIAMTNDTVFVLTNGQMWTTHTSSNVAVYPHPLPSTMIQCDIARSNSYLCRTQFSLAVGGWARSQWLFDMDDSEWESLRTNIAAIAEIIATNGDLSAGTLVMTPDTLSYTYSIPGWLATWWSNFPAAYANLPPWISGRPAAVTYRFEFQSLTNYTNHAPAR